MADMEKTAAHDELKGHVSPGLETSSDDNVSIGKGDLLSQEHVDPVLDAKMHLINNAIDEIGYTRYQLKLFFLNGFGYAVDSLILLLQSIVAPYAYPELNPGGWAYGMTVAVYVGMLIGALFWGLSADIIGRKYAFNFSLLISSVFCIVAGASPNWAVLGTFIALAAFGSGGNLVLDTTVYLEYLPSRYSWTLTLMASWWGAGQFVAGLFAWAFIPNYSCQIPGHSNICNWHTNPGWRYVLFASGALVLIMSLLRVTVIKLRETPKFLVGEGRDAEAVDTLQYIATRYNRPCSLTLERMQACGAVNGGVPSDRRGSVTAHARKRASFAEVGLHLKGLFTTRKLGLSTSLIWFSWTLIGLAYPLYNVFLPIYLRTRGAALGGLSQSEQWTYYAAANLCSIPSPILAGYMCKSRWFWGRRGTMIIGALITMVFFFAYTQVRTNAENNGFTCAISFCLNIYYGTLYAYTPEVLPTAHRATGNGIAIGCNRIMGIISALVATYANTATPVPIYVCAALYIVMSLTAAAFPFEPLGARSS
ncbi:major facilitator superfamily domain-containing protein [Neohortaea acidophila]|uniref:Major facilitator superfamily domain-containing protein n=1 Tax=Neohortaea acidophila TaxID=245834 RepID=A0A6A6Q066_9PEZI|nr:major facilitator superfamily domain-containing protein [Neohortaea acidophila]KAF2485868.1 major facilitator superfamily domain-containing protein [Neohortaea acidophila]